LFAVAAITLFIAACSKEIPDDTVVEPVPNPFMTSLNEPVPYAEVTAEDVTQYADMVLDEVTTWAEDIRNTEKPTFDNVVRKLDAIIREISKAGSNSFMLYWVSPDEATRNAGLEAYKKLDSWQIDLISDKAIFEMVSAVSGTEEPGGPAATLVSDLLAEMRHTGVNLAPESLERFKTLTREINDLSAEYSRNMNTDIATLTLDKAGAEGLPDTFRERYATDEGSYEIPVISANRGPVLNNAIQEDTRRSFATLYANRAADKNLDILDQLVAKRHEQAQIMGHETFADYNLELKMAQTPERVWDFLNNLIELSENKARADLERLKQVRADNGGAPVADALEPWDSGYYRELLLRSEYGVDSEKVREYLQLDKTLAGMMELYQGVLGLEFRAVANPSVWHEEVESYEVYENGVLTGRFYLDLFPRPNKESWFYGVPLTPGNARPEGYEVPVAMLLGNFTRATDELPSLISFSELDTLFHEFGHIVNSMSYNGEFASQSSSRPDFVEAMSQIFENWIWSYDVLKTFAHHYETGEVLPKELFQSMLDAKNVTSGLSAHSTLKRSSYDMELYNRYDPDNPMPTDDIWRSIAGRFVGPLFIEGTHPQASWIHINTHPVYMYGYLWSRVFAQDMFTQFEENGLRDADTGKRYRQLIMANGTQRPVVEALEEFLGRPSNSEAYIRSLGLD
jgi:Zn-dependent oligopeptidase